jgi:hydrogenase maturation protease
MLTIIGCGNPNRSDDGAGVAVVQRLMGRVGSEPGPGVRIYDAGTNGMEVMFKARGSSELVLVDASTSHAEPGSIYEVPGERLENVPDPGYGLHGFRWDHALYAGKKIYGRDFPARVTVYLIERQSLELGVGLSEPVERAVTRVLNLLLERMPSAPVPSAGVGA